MPFPWKKNRVTRISQIVADLQSPKRGGSLVVETGFPTSLIDLFVKNRSRFTKPKSKKPVKPGISDPPPLSPAPPPMLETSSSSDFTVLHAEAAPSLTPLVTARVGGDDGGVAGSGPEVNRVGECGCGSGSKSVLAAFLKVLFVVVVLITSVMKLTVGITVSAFALLFLEHAGKRFVSCLRPCYMGIIIETLTKTVSNCVWFWKLRLKIKKDCEGSDSELAVVEGENIVVSELVVGAECSSNSLSFDEIEVVESETESEVGACREETCFVVGPELDCVNRDKKLGCPEMPECSDGRVVDSCEICQCESKGSISVRFKSKMVKKLVPKKLRTSMKEKREKKSKESEADESPSSGKEDISPSLEMVEEQGDVGKDEEENGNGSPLLPKIKLVCIQEDEVDHGITCCQESSLARVEEVAVISENNRIDRVGNSGYIILFVIALAGLLVGRLPALILTMTWCFMLKIVTAQGKSQNVPRSNVLVQNLDRTLEGLR